MHEIFASGRLANNSHQLIQTIHVISMCYTNTKCINCSPLQHNKICVINFDASKIKHHGLAMHWFSPHFFYELCTLYLKNNKYSFALALIILVIKQSYLNNGFEWRCVRESRRFTIEFSFWYILPSAII